MFGGGQPGHPRSRPVQFAAGPLRIPADREGTRPVRDPHRLRQWGDKYLTDKPSALLRRKTDQAPVVAALVTEDGEAVSIHEAELVAGPGRDPACATWRLADRADP